MSNQYAAQIEAKSIANLKAKGVRATGRVRAIITVWAELGAEVTNIERSGNKITPHIEFTDVSEFWTDEDFEEFRAETGESWEEFYGTPRGEPRW